MKTTKGCLDHILKEGDKPSKEELLARFGNKKAKPFKKGEEPPEKGEDIPQEKEEDK